MWIDCRNTKMHYKIFGEGKPLLAIHGFGVDMNIMTACLEPLFSGAHGFQRIYLDLPGMGKTAEDAAVNSTDEILSILLEFIDKTIGKEEFYVVGESYGGYLIRGLIAKLGPAQITKAAFICPVIFPKQADRQLPAKQIMVSDEQFLKSLPDENRRAFQQENVILTEAVYRRWLSDVKAGLDSSRPEQLDKILEQYGFGKWYTEPCFTGEVLWLFGKQDHVVGYRDIFKIESRYPHSTIAIINRAGHYMQYEQEEVFAFHMKRWLGR